MGNARNVRAGTAVVVGRFQIPDLHDGHIKLINEVNEYERGMVFVGVAATPVTKKNPLDFKTRKLLIESYLGPNVVVRPIYDRASDLVWSETLDQQIKDFAPNGPVVLLCGRDSFKDYYHGEFPVVEIDSTVEHLNATAIRQACGGNQIDSIDFRKGVIYASQSMFPRVQPTVDIVVHDNDNNILLGRKADKKTYCFVGGFIDMSDATAAHAACRELVEETSLEANVDNLQWLTTVKIKDWRDTPSSSIMTTCFTVNIQDCTGIPKAADDIVEVAWKPANEALFEQLGSGHHVLLRAFLDKKVR